MLAPQLACPRDGHLEAACRVFACLDDKHDSGMVFDPTHAEVEMSDFKECDWREFCGDVREPLPPNVPSPRGQEVEIRLHVDSDHAGRPIGQAFAHRLLCIFEFSATDMVF
jgi:hypothetical protein